MDQTPNLKLNKIDKFTLDWEALEHENLDKIDANNPKHNFSATTDPTVNDDSSAGYNVGSIWINTSTKSVFQCTDATTGAAIWTQLNTEAVSVLPVVDTTTIVKGSDDSTKQIRFEVDGLTTNTTRVLTVQDKDITIAGTDDIPSTTDNLPEGATNKYYTDDRVSANADVSANTTHRNTTTGNPHQVTKSEVGLGNVTNDAQLKRAAGDINSFTEKTTPANADLILIEDSADSYNKKKVQIGNLPTGSGGATTFTGLTDTPSDYTGQQGKVVAVKSTEDGLEFVAASGTGDMTKSVYDTDNDGVVDNAEALQGYVPSTTPTANAIPVADSNGKLNDWVDATTSNYNIDGGNSLSNYTLDQVLDCGTSA